MSDSTQDTFANRKGCLCRSNSGVRTIVENLDALQMNFCHIVTDCVSTTPVV